MWKLVYKHRVMMHQHVQYPVQYIPFVFTLPFFTCAVKRYVRKGIPNEHRGEVWMSVSKAQKMMKQNGGLYQRLLEQELDPNVLTEIDIGEFKGICRQ